MMTMKAFRLMMAEKLEVSPNCVANRIYRGQIKPVVKRVNKRVVFVLAYRMRSSKPLGRPSPNPPRLSRKLLGSAAYMKEWRKFQKQLQTT